MSSDLDVAAYAVHTGGHGCPSRATAMGLPNGLAVAGILLSATITLRPQTGRRPLDRPVPAKASAHEDKGPPGGHPSP
jgi:hypothetical protein